MGSNIRLLKQGDIIKLKKHTVQKYGFNADFVKQSHRPFVVGKITDYGAIWLVPSYSHCSDYNSKTEKFYMPLQTPNGDTKYLKFRDMIVVEEADVKIYKENDDTISINEENIKEFSRKFRNNYRLLKKCREYYETHFHHPFIHEKRILINNYLQKPYYWLERDYNIVDKNRKFNKLEEFNKDEFGDILYYDYIQNLRLFRLKRDEYISQRKKYLEDLFEQTKIAVGYIYLTNDGFVKRNRPYVLTDIYSEAKIFLPEDLEDDAFLMKMMYAEREEVNVIVPVLDEYERKSVAKEIAYLEYNTVTQKTFYEAYEKDSKRKDDIEKKFKKRVKQILKEHKK